MLDHAWAGDHFLCLIMRGHAIICDHANYRKLISRSFYANDDLEDVPGCAALRLQAAQALKARPEICLPQHSRENKGKVKFIFQFCLQQLLILLLFPKRYRDYCVSTRPLRRLILYP